MAIYHLNTHTIGRSAGHSAVAAAAYRSASKLVDERTGEVFDFTRKGGVMHAEIVTPAGVPVSERADLWNAAEAVEKRKDARVAREWRAALPHELNEDDRRELAKRMGQAIAERYGVAVDVCIHGPDREGDDRNFHVHMLATTRTIGADGRLGEKARIELSNAKRKAIGLTGASADEITEIRALWAGLANEALERAGVSARISHRSYADQRVELTPTRHIGSAAVAMARRGLEADRIDIHNADREEQARQITKWPEIILDKITATQAVFTRRDIAIELNRYIDDPDQFQILLAGLENSPQMVEMEPASGRDPAKFSTREMIDTERAMVESAWRLAQTGRHGVSGPITNAAIGGVGTLSAEQQNAVRHVLKSGSLAVVIGDAGTGKSFSMKVARKAWQAQGFNVRGAALAGKAADELQAGSGIASRTLASLEFAWKSGKNMLTSRDVLVIDEAGMIGSRQLGRVLKAAEQAGAKVVLLGDDKQLAAIEAGAAFRGVVQHVGAAEITEVRRQKEAWARQAGQQLARGSVADGLAAYAERGHVQIHDSRDAARAALAAAYVGDQGKGSQIILAHSNKDVQVLNEAVREARKERGELAGAARFVTERGDREFAPGDRIAFLKNNRDLGVKNGTLGTVERAGDGSLAVRLDNGEGRQVLASQYAAVDHGYAVTIHKAQGVTVDRAYLLATPGMDRSLAYVGMTRHREAATLFAGADDFTGRCVGRLVDHGAAPYENKPENRLSYFATLENDKGERHTIWGVDLERAIAASGAKRGERIGLEHGGSETVRLLDGATAERNTWHVCSTGDLAAGKLVQVLGRERPKESTLDFANRRGFDGENVMRRWLERGRMKVADLAGKMQRAMRRSLERHGRLDLMPATDIAGTPTVQRPQRPKVETDRQPAPEVKQAAAAGVAQFRAMFEAQKLAELGKQQAEQRVRQRQAELTEQREEAEREQQAERERARCAAIDYVRRANPDRTRKAGEVRAEFEGQPQKARRAYNAAVEDAEKWRESVIRSEEEKEQALVSLGRANEALEAAERRHTGATRKLKEWRKAHPVRAAIGGGGDLARAAAETASELERCQQQARSAQARHTAAMDAVQEAMAGWGAAGGRREALRALGGELAEVERLLPLGEAAIIEMDRLAQQEAAAQEAARQAAAEREQAQSLVNQERQRRINELARLERSSAGAAYTLAVHALRAIRQAGGQPDWVDWPKIERAVIIEAVQDNGQRPADALAAILNNSPGTVEPERQQEVRAMVAQLVRQGLACPQEPPDQDDYYGPR